MSIHESPEPDQLVARTNRLPDEIRNAIAARAALRVIPNFALDIGFNQKFGETRPQVLLPALRAASFNLAFLKYPSRQHELSTFASRVGAALYIENHTLTLASVRAAATSIYHATKAISHADESSTTESIAVK